MESAIIVRHLEIASEALRSQGDMMVILGADMEMVKAIREQARDAIKLAGMIERGELELREMPRQAAE